MLPRPAIANATAQAAQPPAGPDGLVPRRAPAAELIANIRAAVLLRLIETMLKQVQRAGNQDGPTGALLEALVEALKTLPSGRGGRGDGIRDIAAILSRLPPETRPAVERLLHQTIAALPTRVLMEVLRNPESPAAQKLASMIVLLSTSEADEPPAERSRALATLEARLAESRAVHRPFPQRETVLRGDARALQAELSRLFEPDMSRLADTGPAAGRALSARHDIAASPALRRAEPVLHAGTALSDAAAESADSIGTIALAGRPAEDAAATARAEMAVRSVLQATGDAAEVMAAPARPAEAGEAEGQSPGPLVTGRKAEPAATGAQGRADGIARVRPEAIVQFITAVLASLTEAETGTLKALLDKPLLRAAGDTAGTADRAQSAEPGERQRQMPAAAARTTEETAARLPPVAEESPATVERATLPPLRDGPASLPDMRLEPAAVPVTRREAVAPAFVPYLPAEDEAVERDEERSGPREDEDERDEADGEAPGEQGGGAAGDEETGGDDAQPAEDAATAERRERIADLVGPPDPGFAFYQKLGEYWT